MSRADESTLKAALGLMALGGGLIFDGIRRQRHARRIQDASRSLIRSAPQGLVEIQGHALPWDEPFPTVLGTPTVICEWRLEERVSRGKSSTWQVLSTETRGSAFVVSDGTGIVQVHVENSEGDWERAVHDWDHVSDEARMMFMTRVTGLPEGRRFLGLFGRRLRVVERYIRVGSPVYVQGGFQTASNQKPYVIRPAHLNFLGELSNFQKNPSAKRKFFDRNRDGVIDSHELQMGTTVLMKRAHSEVESGERSEAVRVNGVLTSTPEHPLLIFHGHEEHVVSKLSQGNVLRILAGAALIAGGVFVLLMDFSH